MTGKERKTPVVVLTDAEAVALCNAPSRSAPTGARNRSILVLMWRGGLRVQEVLDLRVQDLDLDRRIVQVLDGKGHQSRAVAIDGPACDVVALWLAHRAKLDLRRGTRLHCTLKGGPVDQRYVRAMIDRYAERAGLGRHVHPHALRHSHAIGLVREGVNVEFVRQQLGHADLRTTSVYLQGLGAGERVDVIRERQWNPEGEQ